MTDLKIVTRLYRADDLVHGPEITAAARQAAALIREMEAALSKAAYELNAIRARDGAPQHIVWDHGRPIQTASCTDEYWDALTEQCFAALAKAQEG